MSAKSGRAATVRAALLSAVAALSIFAVGARTADAGTNVYSNSSVIQIPAAPDGQTSGPATPYPSVINVSSGAGQILKVTVTLTGFQHACPDDVNFLLVSPTGQNVNFYARTGGCSRETPVVTLTFDDAAAKPLGDANPDFVSGTYKVSQPDGINLLPGAPASSTATSMAVFNGWNSAGNWSLYAYDCCNLDAGSAAGWSLTITTAAPEAPIPTLGDWGLLLASLALAVAGMRAARRSARRAV